jgi:serine protease Do
MRGRTGLSKTRFFWNLILFSIIAVPYAFASARDITIFCPLPIAETRSIVVHWLTDSGFKIAQTSLEAGQVKISALNGNERWVIVLKPRSPLASTLTAEYTIYGQPESDKLDQLRRFIESYQESFYLMEEDYSENNVPNAVLYQKRYVVCIRAGTEDKYIQFSGFIVGKDGLIISTAHDLEGMRNAIVILNDGQKFKGQVIKIDTIRDLSLIDTNVRINSLISLNNARNLLEIGEKVYSIGCPYNHRGRIQNGIISGPAGKVNNIHLLQVDMRTLPGSSGGPVFDKYGNLVGIVKGRYRGTDSRGFLITVETLIEFLRD